MTNSGGKVVESGEKWGKSKKSGKSGENGEKWLKVG